MIKVGTVLESKRIREAKWVRDLQILKHLDPQIWWAVGFSGPNLDV